MNNKTLILSFLFIISIVFFSFSLLNSNKTFDLNCTISTIRNSNQDNVFFDENIALTFEKNGDGLINIRGKGLDNVKTSFDRSYLFSYEQVSRSSFKIEIKNRYKHPLDNVDDDYFERNIFLYKVGTIELLQIHSLKNAYIFYEGVDPVAVCVEKEHARFVSSE